MNTTEYKGRYFCLNDIHAGTWLVTLYGTVSHHHLIVVHRDLFIAFATQFQALNIFPLRSPIRLGRITFSFFPLVSVSSALFFFLSLYFYSGENGRCALSRIERFLSTPKIDILLLLLFSY